MQKGTDEYEIYFKRFRDTSNTLLELIDFLKIYDKKFKKFTSTSYVNLAGAWLSDDDMYIFRSLLNNCLDLPISDLPNLAEFVSLLNEKGMASKAGLHGTEKMLNGIIFEDPDTPIALVAKGILIK